jgi:hypothetical protein
MVVVLALIVPLVALANGSTMTASAAPSDNLASATSATLGQGSFRITNLPFGDSIVYQAPDRTMGSGLVEYGIPSTISIGSCFYVETRLGSGLYYLAASGRSVERNNGLAWLRVVEHATGVHAKEIGYGRVRYRFDVPRGEVVAGIEISEGVVTVEEGLIQKIVLNGEEVGPGRTAAPFSIRRRLSDFGTAPPVEAPTVAQLVEAPESARTRIESDACPSGE